MTTVTRALDAIIKTIASAMVAAIFLITLGQVVLRYGFRINLPWTAETTQILLVYIVMLVAAYAAGHGSHFAVTTLATRMPARARVWAGRANAALTATFAGVALVYGTRLALSQMGTTVPALGVPVGAIYLALPIGAALTLFYAAAALAAPRPTAD